VRALTQEGTRPVGQNGTAAEGNHSRCGGAENVGRNLFFLGAKVGFAPLEELGYWSVTVLKLAIEIDEAPAAEPGHLCADRRLARAHEADEREVFAERAYRGDQSIRSR
jgi:hypothetical protein